MQSRLKRVFYEHYQKEQEKDGVAKGNEVTPEKAYDQQLQDIRSPRSLQESNLLKTKEQFKNQSAEKKNCQPSVHQQEQKHSQKKQGQPIINGRSKDHQTNKNPSHQIGYQNRSRVTKEFDSSNKENMDEDSVKPLLQTTHHQAFKAKSKQHKQDQVIKLNNSSSKQRDPNSSKFASGRNTPQGGELRKKRKPQTQNPKQITYSTSSKDKEGQNLKYLSAQKEQYKNKKRLSDENVLQSKENCNEQSARGLTLIDDGSKKVLKGRFMQCEVGESFVLSEQNRNSQYSKKNKHKKGSLKSKKSLRNILEESIKPSREEVQLQNQDQTNQDPQSENADLRSSMNLYLAHQSYQKILNQQKNNSESKQNYKESSQLQESQPEYKDLVDLFQSCSDDTIDYQYDSIASKYQNAFGNPEGKMQDLVNMSLDFLPQIKQMQASIQFNNNRSKRLSGLSNIDEEEEAENQDQKFSEELTKDDQDKKIIPPQALDEPKIIELNSSQEDTLQNFELKQSQDHKVHDEQPQKSLKSSGSKPQDELIYQSLRESVRFPKDCKSPQVNNQVKKSNYGVQQSMTLNNVFSQILENDSSQENEGGLFDNNRISKVFERPPENKPTRSSSDDKQPKASEIDIRASAQDLLGKCQKQMNQKRQSIQTIQKLLADHTVQETNQNQKNLQEVLVSVLKMLMPVQSQEDLDPNQSSYQLSQDQSQALQFCIQDFLIQNNNRKVKTDSPENILNLQKEQSRLLDLDVGSLKNLHSFFDVSALNVASKKDDLSAQKVSTDSKTGSAARYSYVLLNK